MKNKTTTFLLIFTSTLAFVSTLLLVYQQIKEDAIQELSREEEFKVTLEAKLDSDCINKGIETESIDCLAFKIDGLNWFIRTRYPSPMVEGNPEGVAYNTAAVSMLSEFYDYVDSQCSLGLDVEDYGQNMTYLQCRKQLLLDRVTYNFIYENPQRSDEEFEELLNTISDEEVEESSYQIYGPTIEEKIAQAINIKWAEYCPNGGGTTTYEMLACANSANDCLENLFVVSAQNALEQFKKGGELKPTKIQVEEIESYIEADKESFSEYAENHCNFVSSEYYGGTLQPIIYYSCYNRLLQDRTIQ